MRPSWRLSLSIGLGFAALAVANLLPIDRGVFHWVLAGGLAALSAHYLTDSRRRYRRDRPTPGDERSSSEPHDSREPVR